MLAKAKECWDQEQEEREAEKAHYLAQRIPSLQTRGLSLSALQVGLEWGRRWGWGCGGGPEPKLAQLAPARPPLRGVWHGFKH